MHLVRPRAHLIGNDSHPPLWTSHIPNDGLPISTLHAAAVYMCSIVFIFFVSFILFLYLTQVFILFFYIVIYSVSKLSLLAFFFSLFVFKFLFYCCYYYFYSCLFLKSASVSPRGRPHCTSFVTLVAAAAQR